MNIVLNDTIAAIATSTGESGIGMVRISGRKALSVAGRIFMPKSKGRVAGFKSHTVHYGWVCENAKTGSRPEPKHIDEVLMTIMRAPRTYTREDTVEISCHGGMAAVRRVLELALKNGCRLAQPGEFTRRAFLNGRIDLAQAEAVLEIIRARTDSALEMGLQQLEGVFSRQVGKARSKVFDTLALLESAIDFPEEDGTGIRAGDFSRMADEAAALVRDLIRRCRRSRVIQEGVTAVICGRANTGKSSLLNAFLKYERSIVTPICGTTRDAIEETLDIKGVPVKLVDTAGLIKPRNAIEKIAVKKAKERIRNADLVLLVFDASRNLSGADNAIIRQFQHDGRVIAVVNKIDLKQKLEESRLEGKFSRRVMVSAKKMLNLSALEDAVIDSAFAKEPCGRGSAVAASLRHILLLEECEKLIAASVESLDNGLSLECAALELKAALGSLDEISGRKFSQELLDRIFEKFCIGK